MTYTQLYYLRYSAGFPTLVLERLFPDEKRKICLVALCSLQDHTLQEVAKENTVKHVQRLRTLSSQRWSTLPHE